MSEKVQPVALSLAPDGEGKALPLGLQGYPTEADGVPIFYRKVKVARVGDWTHRGTGEHFSITPQRADEWVRNTKALSAAGIKPFLPGQHREEFNAADNFGYAVDLAREGDDLYAVLALYGDDARKAAAVNSRSVYVVKDALDAKGNVYPGEAITHIALVPNPALPDLGGTLKIAASAGGGPAREVRIFTLSAADRSNLMKPETLQKLRAKLNLAADVKDEDVAEKAAALALADPPPDKTPEVTALSAKVATLEAERNAARTEAESLRLSATVKEPDALSLSLIGRAFKTDAERVIESGVISSAGMDELKSLCIPNGKPAPFAMALSAGSPDPFWSRLCEIIRKNPGIKTDNVVKRDNLRLAASPNHQSYDPAAQQPDPAAQQAEGLKEAQEWQARQQQARGLQTA